MGTRVYRLSKHHEELFGNDQPRSFYFILMTVFDFWEMHPLRPEFMTLYQYITEDQRRAFRDKYVEEVPLAGLDGVAPGWHFNEGVHRSWRLLGYLKRDKKINVPLIIFYGDEWPDGYVYEGHHRAGAAKELGWDTVPAFVFNLVGIEPGGYCYMTDRDRKDMGRIQEEKGLPNTSRIHGMKINFWSEKELRSFMFPRKQDRTKYGVQDMITSKCQGEDHPEWNGIERGITIKIRNGDFKLPWEITQ